MADAVIPPPKIRMYCTAICPYCVAAEKFLLTKGVREIEKIRVDVEPTLTKEMMEKTGRRTVPQIFVGDMLLGGFDDLVTLDRTGRLQGLLGQDGLMTA